MKKLAHVVFAVDVPLPKSKDRLTTQYKASDTLSIYLTSDVPGGGVVLDEQGALRVVPMSNVRSFTPSEETKPQAVAQVRR